MKVMSQKLPTLQGIVSKVKKGKKINYGFVFGAIAINGYRGPTYHAVFVGEHMLGGAKLVEGMLIAFDAQQSTVRAHRGKYEACNVVNLCNVARTA